MKRSKISTGSEIKLTASCALFLFIFFIIPLAGFGQEEKHDSLTVLSEVTVRAFEQHRQASLSGVSVKVIESNNADRYNKTSLVAGLNTVAGVRMEERSPGSYRINIRGSSLCSPFGVRNVKVYWNNIPITDAGGNTYFNQFAWNNFTDIEIVKGPVSSMYGAGTGGLILVNSFNQWQPGVSIDYVESLTGSGFQITQLKADSGCGCGSEAQTVGRDAGIKARSCCN